MSEYDEHPGPTNATEAPEPAQTLRERRQQSVRQSRMGQGSGAAKPEAGEPAADSQAIDPRPEDDHRARTGTEPMANTVPANPVPDLSVRARPSTQAKKVRAENSTIRKLAGAVSALSGRLRDAVVDDEPTDSTAHRQPEVTREVSGVISEEQWEKELKLSLREAEVGDVARVCVGSPKGGIGKSSVAYAFAGAVARYTNLRVAVVDVDPNFGSLRTLVPRPIEGSVLDLAAEANDIRGLSQMRNYVSKNETMGLDIVLGPTEEYELAAVEDLGAVYKRADAVLSEFYDMVVYDMGVGFRDPAIREILAFCDEFVLAVDAEQVTNTMVSRAIKYLETLSVGLSRHTTTLVINHLRPSAEESASASAIRQAHTSLLNHRRVTEIPYDARMSQLLNDRSFDIEEQSMSTRLRVLLTVGAVLKGIQENRNQDTSSILVPDATVPDAGGDYDARTYQ